MRRTLKQYADVFNRDDLDLERTSLLNYTINLSNSQPINHAPRGIAPARMEEMKNFVGELAVQRVMELSGSPWSKAVVLVKKKDSTIHFCVAYRALNNVTVKDSYRPAQN